MTQVTYASEGPIASITLNRPEKLNALTPQMLQAIETFIRQADGDAALRVVILRAEGKAFSVGADINIWSALSPQEFRLSWIRDGHRAFAALARCRLPVIAAIQGMAFGGGLELALAADLRVTEESATLALPEASLGTVPGWGGTQRLPELIGRARAKQMILTAQRVRGDQAEAWGLVNRLCPAGQVREAALAMAQEVAALAPVSVQVAKKVIDGAMGDGLGETLEMLGGIVTQTTADMKEGIAALKEKRKASFSGQ